MDSDRDGYIKISQAPEYILARFKYLISSTTLRRWRKREPLHFPATAEDLDAWFQRQLEQKQ